MQARNAILCKSPHFKIFWVSTNKKNPRRNEISGGIKQGRTQIYSMVKCDSTHKWLQSLKADLKLSLKLVNFIFWRNINTGDIILRPPGSQESFKPPRLPELKVGQLGTEVLCLQTRTGMHFIDNLIVGIFFLNFYYYCYIGCVQYRKVCH